MGEVMNSSDESFMEQMVLKSASPAGRAEAGVGSDVEVLLQTVSSRCL